MANEVAVVDNDARELAPREKIGGLIRPVATIDQIIQAQEDTRNLIAKALKKDRDFGKIKGTNRETLYKAGAERVLAAYGCWPRLTIVEKEIDHDREVPWQKDKWVNGRKEPVDGMSHGLYRYVLRCEAVHRETGIVIGMGHGACSTMEAKYIETPRNVENTVLKMAGKRALVDCVLMTFGLSDQFTQDMDEQTGEGEEPGESAKKNGNGNGHSDEPASDSQVNLLRRFMKSSHFTNEEREGVEAQIALESFTKSKASEMIDRAKAELEKRKKERSSGHPAGVGGRG